MKAILKSFHVNCWAGPEEFQPDSPQIYGIWLTVEIGSDSELGTELFQVFTCNEEWLERGLGWIPEHGRLEPRQRYLVIDGAYDDLSVKAELEGYLEGCEGDTWGAVVAQVSKIGFSEFEHYQA